MNGDIDIELLDLEGDRFTEYSLIPQNQCVILLLFAELDEWIKWFGLANRRCKMLMGKPAPRICRVMEVALTT